MRREPLHYYPAGTATALWLCCLILVMACAAAPVDQSTRGAATTSSTRDADTDETVAGTDESTATSDPSPAVKPFDDVIVYPRDQRVEIRAWTCLEEGYLEQIACSPGTREHESLVVIRAKPSNIHAALLMAGFESGRPGRWDFDPESKKVTLLPPRGDEVDVWFRYAKNGETVTEPARRWIRDHQDERTFPKQPWIFGGSQFKPNPEWMGPGEHYVADMTGSIIGLVTFGDETIGLKEVISDQAAVHEPEWMVNTNRMPKEGTEVTVIILPHGRLPDGANDEDASDDSETDSPPREPPDQD